jgi:excisionase family DNA binding protein
VEGQTCRAPTGVTIRDAAAELDVTSRQIYRLLDRGELEAFHVGFHRYVTRESLDWAVARRNGVRRRPVPGWGTS